MLLRADLEATPALLLFSAERVKSRPFDPLIKLEKGECVFCRLKGSCLLNFSTPIVLHMEWLPGEISNVCTGPSCLCLYSADFTYSVSEARACARDLVDHTV